MKKLAFSLLSIISFFAGFAATNALTIKDKYSLITNNGYELTRSAYNRSSEKYSDTVIDSMPQDIIEMLAANDYEMISSEKKYIITNSLLDRNGNVILNIDKEVTKEEALYAAEEVNAGNDRGNSGQGSWETSSKVFFYKHWNK